MKYLILANNEFDELVENTTELKERVNELIDDESYEIEDIQVYEVARVASVYRDEVEFQWDDKGSKKKKAKVSRKNWDVNETGTLIELYNENYSSGRMAEILQRTEGSVRTKMYRMGMGLKGRELN